MTRLNSFHAYRERMNKRIAAIDHPEMQRFIELDIAAFREGVLDPKVKELFGLMASVLLRNKESIDHHLVQCVRAGWGDEELYDALNLALVIGGAIGLPSVRHAVETLDLLHAEAD
jgi:alkylhydroperoxidase/carboxymuconolactone decarboxylase family protein YurZ